MDAKLLAQWSINILYGVFLVGNLVRSIWLKKGFSSDTIRMYLISFIFMIISNLGFSGTLSPETVATLITACAGFVIGKKFEDEK